MNTMELEEYLKEMKHPGFYVGVHAANRLPFSCKIPCAIIANTEPDSSNGLHWTALFISRNGYGEYFDSFGRPPTGYHQKFIKEKTRVWTYNKNTLQNVLSSVCGQYCLMYLLFKMNGFTLAGFVHFLSNNTLHNDAIITHLFKSFFCKQ